MDYILNGSAVKRAALINDISCFGRCSLTVAQPIVSAYNVEAVPLPTALLSTHTGEFEDYRSYDLSSQLSEIIEHFRKLKIEFDCIYTGYFCSVRQIEIAKKFISEFKKDNTLVVVDPVMGDNGRLYAGFNKEFANEMRDLCKTADIITPNYTEAMLLFGENREFDLRAVHSEIGAKNTIITGVPYKDEIGYYLQLDGEENPVIIKNKYINRVLHGCGDVFASSLCGEMLSGKDIKSAVENAAGFCDLCIEKTMLDDPYCRYGLHFEGALKDLLAKKTVL